MMEYQQLLPISHLKIILCIFHNPQSYQRRNERYRKTKINGFSAETKKADQQIKKKTKIVSSYNIPKRRKRPKLSEIIFLLPTYQY